MPRGTRLSELEKAKIKAFNDSGCNISKISKLTGRTRCVITSYLQNQEEYGKKYSTGRKPKITGRYKHQLLNLASNSAKSCRELSEEINIPVSHMSVWRTLNKADQIVRGVMKEKPTLLKHHKTARIEFANKVLDTHCDWIIFSGEKKFNLDGPDGFQSYWQDARKEHLIFSKRNFKSSVTVWGAFAMCGTIDLQFVNSKLNSHGYLLMLESSVVPFLQDNKRKPYVLMKDESRIYTNRQEKSLLSCRINTMDLPESSPDLNPMEYLWSKLARHVYDGYEKYDSVEELKLAILEEWKKVDQSLLANLINSMKNRLSKLTKNKSRPS